MKNTILTICLVLIVGNAWAFGDVSYSQEEARWNKSLKELYPAKSVQSEPVVQVDRSLVTYKNDPTVLVSVSKPRPVSIPVVVEEPKVIETPKESEVIIKTEFCDDTTSDCTN